MNKTDLKNKLNKIDFKDKNTMRNLIIAGLLLLIILPILWNKGSSIWKGLMIMKQQSMPKQVQVATPAKRTIEPQYTTTGRVDAEISIDVIARVDGWLDQLYFKEGDIVNKGEKLFQIQPDEYRIAVQDAAARVNENQALYQNAVINYRRAAMLVKDDMISREDYDDSIANRNSKKAVLDAARAQYQQAKLNLSYTSIVAPMTGRIGKLNISQGNYVTQGSGALATIYSTSPIRVIFDLKSGDYIQMKKYFNEEKKAKDLGHVEVKLKLADGTIYDKIGKINFTDNKIDETTGTVKMRAQFDNPIELLLPGDFVNVILTIKHPTEVMTIPQSAAQTAVGTGYYVWVVKDGKAIKKDIVVNKNVDNNWIVESGLDYTDQVIVQGIQSIYQSGQAVNATPYKEETQNDTEKKGENK